MQLKSSGTLLRLALAAEDAAFRGRSDDAANLLEQCEAEVASDAHAIALLRRARAEFEMSRSRFPEARAGARAAALSLRRLGRPYDALRAQEIEARSLWRLGDNAGAQKLFEKLLKHWERSKGGTGQVDGEVRCLVHLTSLHSRAQRYEQAIIVGTRATLLAKKTSDPDLYYPKAANALAGVHFRQACQLHPDSSLSTHITALGPTESADVLRHCRIARALMLEVRRIAIQANHSYQAALYGSNIGQLMVLMNEIDTALPLMEEFLSAARERGHKFQEADALQAIGWTHLCASRHETALRYLTQAIAIAESLDAKPLLMTLHFDYAAAAEKVGDIKAALYHHRMYTKHWQQLAIGEQREQSEKAMTEAEPPYLRSAERYIQSRMPTLPSIQEIALSVDVSVRSLQTAFRRYRNITPNAYILDLRYQGTYDALRGDRESGAVARACAEFGFAYSSHFVREFRKRFGVAPSEVSVSTSEALKKSRN